MQNSTKTSLLLFLFSLIFNWHANGQAPAYLWAKDDGGSNDDEGYSMTTDASGNVYVTGGFLSDSITFGSYTLKNSGPGWYDFFLVKYNSSGTVLWAKSGTGANRNDEGYGVAVDNAGGVYVTGYTASNSITFGTNTLTNIAGGPFGTNDAFLVKYDANGNVLWAKGIGKSGEDNGYTVATDASNNVYVSGDFTDTTLTFGSSTITNTSPGYIDIFVAKYTSSGTAVWAIKAGGNYNDYPYLLNIDGSGNVFLNGFYSSTSITLGSTTLTNAGTNNWDVFITKLNSSGVFQWAKGAGGTNFDFAVSLASDASGNTYMSGSFMSPSITFGTTTLTNTGGTNGKQDLFLVKYDPSGTVVWAKTLGSAAGDEYASSVVVDASGNAYITGSFTSASIAAGATTLTNTGTGTMDVFVIKYSSAGNVLWAKSAGGTANDQGLFLDLDSQGNLYVLGYYKSTSLVLGTTTLTSAGGMDMFLAKLASTVGVEEYASNVVPLTVYPNPTATSFTVQLPSENTSGATLKMFDNLGRTVMQQTISGYTSDIETSGFSSGIYTVIVEARDKVYLAKLVKP